ncbi:hypothetical protein [Cryptosporangium phraense]|uniref:hypothetical protein n=1 Tax=Cryptosporangium phraense TaxID=2593070 RepID=UPI00197A7B45|nr:hypothetical protein [Cryptosporangium phraense]
MSQTERVLSAVAVDDPRIPSRICGLLVQRAVPVTRIELRREVNTWAIRLVVRVAGDAEARLVAERLNRLVGVVEVSC